MNFGNLASANLSEYQDFKQHDSRGVFLSMSFGLGNNASVNASVGRHNGQSNYNVNATRPPDYDGGWGWGVQTGDAGSSPYRQDQVQYLGKGGEVTLVGQDINGQGIASLDVTGTAVLMDGSVQPSRRIYDGFALVSTDGVAGIPVLHENRVIGVTDRGDGTFPFSATATVVNNCNITATNLNVGASALSRSALKATVSITAQCTNGDAYRIALNGGATANVAARQMTRSGEGGALSYQLYVDSGLTTNLGDGTGGITQATGTGTGSSQMLTVYGVVPAQTKPAPGTYTDTITATISF